MAPELSLELFEYEQKAFERTRYKLKPAVNHMTIDATDPERPIVTAPINVIRKLADRLMLPNFVELPNGYARTYFHDAIPHRARMAVNALVHKLWRK